MKKSSLCCASFLATTKMACEKIASERWDWKSGVSTHFDVGGAKIPMNYFSCGTYYFDGDFQVVKFPKGMQLYHGSGALANANVEFPAGLDYYKPHEMGKQSVINHSALTKELVENQDESVEEATSKFFNVSAGWFADPTVAQLYSHQNKTFAQRCGDKCINVYELKEDAVFIVLDNNYNIWRLLNDASVPDTAKRQLRFMYNLDTIKADYDPEKYGSISIQRKKRRSYRDVDLPFTEWLCGFMKGQYAGYAANIPMEKGQRYFHLEFMFCSPMKWLKRNLSNKLDWQHMDLKDADKAIKQFMEQMSHYKSTNVDFHSGDLLEHSIWSLLFAEQLLFNLTQFGSPPSEMKKKIAAAAFIHDIGKMAPDQTTRRRHDYIYYSIPDHPAIGGDYIRGTKKLPLVDKNMKQVGAFDVPAFLGALGFNDGDVASLAKLIDLHWEFGDYLRKWKGPGDSATVNAFIDRVGRNEPFSFFFALVIVSMADVLASQPFGMNNLTADLNHHSHYFPFITNVPKKYRGGNIADLTSERRNAFAEAVLTTVANQDRMDID